ncbi:tail fiber assembly protein [Pseudomonas mosselii]|uniref:tail fiber assembly protein n=1 Tax=Pseudomonas mosselii TaxID=78327 RepID=UPI001E3B28A6|nr:tail fiber assembly protein [Pseudomonas mosselii]WJR28903.1 tail fiber assembly protein [Pseudomonas mosselii]
MPYAANGKIAEDKFAGSIKISTAQYAEALEGMCAGLVVTIDGGFKVSLPEVDELLTPALPTPDELRMYALAKRDGLLSRASLRMAPLQDAIDLESATQEEIAILTLWRQYRVDLNRIDQQPGFPQAIIWPQAPDALAPQ